MENLPTGQFFIVNGLVSNEEGKILLVRRERAWHKESHNLWELPGGKVDFREDPEVSVVRETKEESGFDVEVIKLIPKVLSFGWDHNDRLSHQLLLCYECKLIGGNACLDDHGVNKIEWFAPKEIMGLDCLPGTKEFLQLYLEKNGN